MKTILLFGAGKSATVLIEYLLSTAITENWKIVVADADLQLVKSKVDHSQRAMAVSFDIRDDEERVKHIREADLVISLLPPHLHNEVARDCVRLHKHLLTASYVDDQMRELAPEIEKNRLIFLCEMGLDPGIDHMSAIRLINEIHRRQGKIVSFRSHCGGLVAPESDDNPWHYKISWNPRNVIMAGKSGAHYREDGRNVHLPYEVLFNDDRTVEVPGLGRYGWYPNRDSLAYAETYGIQSADTIVRTTLRHPDFMYGWRNIIDLKLVDETPMYNTDGKTLQQCFKEHMDLNGFGQWLQQKLNERFAESKDMMENLMKLVEAEKEAWAEGKGIPQSFITADGEGNLTEVEIDDVKNKAASYLAHKMHEANLTLKQLFFLGLDDRDTLVNRGFCSAADILQFAVERKLTLRPYDKDMIVMLHEIDFLLDGVKHSAQSCLVARGENNLHTAMAKTVGLPLGIAARHILTGRIKTPGLLIPVSPEIYEPVLEDLAEHGIRFQESVSS